MRTRFARRTSHNRQPTLLKALKKQRAGQSVYYEISSRKKFHHVRERRRLEGLAIELARIKHRKRLLNKHSLTFGLRGAYSLKEAARHVLSRRKARACIISS